jgi:DMSO/TMAO reductase YedYZ molybdopterin-dependent catalytic subunit
VAQFHDPWQQMLAGNPMLHRDLLEFRQMLESQAAALAADRATDVDVACLDAAHARLDEQYENDDLAANIEADVAFHQAVAEASHNALIGHLTASLMRLIQGHVSTNLEYLHARPQRWNQLRAQHRAIWQAIRAHKPDAAAQAARGHIEFVRLSMDDNALSEERRMSAQCGGWANPGGWAGSASRPVLRRHQPAGPAGLVSLRVADQADASAGHMPTQSSAVRRGLARQEGTLRCGAFDMAQPPQRQETLQFQPVKVLGRGNLVGQVLELIALEGVVFKVRIGRRSQSAASVSKCALASALISSKAWSKLRSASASHRRSARPRQSWRP